jgi:hypothetical protein
MMKPPVGWCAVLTSLESDLADRRDHDATEPEHADCDGGAAACEASRRRVEALYRYALRECSGSHARDAAAPVGG